jgi:hypothetical protein
MKLTKPNKRTLIASPTEKKKNFLHGINILHTCVKLMCSPQLITDIILCQVKILFSI